MRTARSQRAQGDARGSGGQSAALIDKPNTGLRTQRPPPRPPRTLAGRRHAGFRRPPARWPEAALVNLSARGARKPDARELLDTPIPSYCARPEYPAPVARTPPRFEQTQQKAGFFDPEKCVPTPSLSWHAHRYAVAVRRAPTHTGPSAGSSTAIVKRASSSWSWESRAFLSSTDRRPSQVGMVSCFQPCRAGKGVAQRPRDFPGRQKLSCLDDLGGGGDGRVEPGEQGTNRHLGPAAQVPQFALKAGAHGRARSPAESGTRRASGP